MAKSSAILRPNLGLYLGIPKLSVPLHGLQDGLNFRVKDGKLTNLNLGWTRFSDFTLNGPVALIDNFFLRSGAQLLIFGTLTDLYAYDDSTDTVSFITPRYATGTVTIAAGTPTAVVGVGSSWEANVAVGDQIAFFANDETDPAADWYTIAEVTDDTHLVLSSAHDGDPGFPSGDTYTVRKLFTGTLADPWETETFMNAQPSGDDLWYATNGGVDHMVSWDGSASQVTILDSIGFRARHLVRYANMMIYADILKDAGDILPTTIINSDLSSPEVVDGTGVSNEFVVHDGVDAIEAVRVLGDNLAMYTPRAVVLGQFVGSDVVFVFRKAVEGIGPLTGRLVADFGDYHEFVGPDTLYRFDGVSAARVNSHVWREVLRTRDPARIGLAYHHFDEENGDLIWSIPLTTDAGAGDATAAADQAYVAHYLETVEKVPEWFYPYSKRDFPFTAAGFWERGDTLTWDQLTDTWADLNFRWNDQFFSEAFPFNMGGAADGKVYTINTSQNADTAALESYVHFGRRPTQSGRERGLVARLYPFATQFAAATYTLDVTTYLANHAQGPDEDSQVDGYDPTQAGNHFVSPFRAARFFSAKFGTAGPGEPWELGGYDVDLRPGGGR